MKRKPSLPRGPDPFLVAHRGMPSRHPENSAAGFAAARDSGAPVVELDVRMTADELLIVLHDPSPARLTGDSRPAEELPASDLVEQRYADDPAQRLLLLDEALALLCGRSWIDIEMKPSAGVPPERAVAALLAALDRAGAPSDVIVSSHDEFLIREVRARAPLIATGLVFRAMDARDAVGTAIDCAADLIVINKMRVSRNLISKARNRDLEVWAYTVNDPLAARRLVDAGCRAVVTDDYAGMSSALVSAAAASVPAVLDAGALAAPLMLVLDLGSSSTKGLLVDPCCGVVSRASVSTPVCRAGGGLVEHDPNDQLDAVRGLLASLAARHPDPPSAAAICSQRSTGLWARREDLGPLTPAVSWQDRRGRAVVKRLEARRTELERIARLPLDPAWTAITGRVLADEYELSVDRVLIPLGAWIAAALTGEAPCVDPTLANRMFLVDAASGSWSATLLEAFGLDESDLPDLCPTVADHGRLSWPGGGSIPLVTLIGDQQAAYVGAAGPLGRRVVINVGTGAFAMRASGNEDPVPVGARRAPLWTSTNRTRPVAFLLENAVVADAREQESTSSTDARAMQVARRLALGEDEPNEFARRVAAAAAGLIRSRDRTAILAGGVLASPHMVALLRQHCAIEIVPASERELTALGAARLAAAATGTAWRVPDAGGLVTPDPFRV